MESTVDRRNDQSERVPVHIAVELGEGDFQDPFGADTLNLSRGGISMRAPCLPDIGSRLLVRFQCLPSGTVVTAQGEVVWAHLEGERCGEFGLSFVDLDAKSEWLIEEMIAEHAVHGCGRPPATEAAAKVATLELEGSAEAIATRLASADDDQAVFEQDLELLRLGRAVRAHAPGAARMRGSIANVELRMVGSVPMLAVTVSFGEQPSQAGAAPAPVPAAATAAADAGAELAGQAHDTEQDLSAPQGLEGGELEAAADSPARRVTLTEFEAEPTPPPVSTAGTPPDGRAAAVVETPAAAGPASAPGSIAPPASAAPPALHPQPTPVLAQAPAAPAMRTPPPLAMRTQPPLATRTQPPLATRTPPPLATRTPPPLATRTPPPTPAPAPRVSRPPRPLEFESDAGRDYSTSFALPSRDDELDYALEEMSPPAWQPAVANALRVVGQQCYVLFGWAAGAARGAYRKSLPQVRIGLLRAAGLLRGVYVLRFAPLLGALRRFAGVQLGLRRRRTTAGPGLPRSQGSSLGRTLLLGVLGAGATALGVYALAPDGGNDIQLHRPVRAAVPAAEPAGPAAESEPAEADQPAAAAPANAASASAAASAAPPVKPDPQKVPSARQVPAGSPFAVDVREGAPRAEPASGKTPLRFGAASVPRARRFALRMSGRIQGVQGVSDPGGFSVTVLGVLSLDRAGPISSAHKAVARSMIINKGDRAELNIRFAEGKRPAYQVSAEGSTLHLLIEDR